MSIKSQTRPSKRKTDQSTDNTSVKKLKQHPFHHDSEHSITIISYDNIEFKASRSRLVQTSQFFRDLLDIPAPEHENQKPKAQKPIPLDFRSSIISAFLDLISSSSYSIEGTRFALGKITSEQVHKLYGKKHSKYPTVKTGVRGQIARLPQTSSPGVFLANDWTSIAESFDPPRFEGNSRDDSTSDNSDGPNTDEDEDEDEDDGS
ncbi:uncharacterized protein L199_000690 [Kwoniella botswanensis]|uniref:uncharacterized protein n=1 Tax=Kwoniella botswanensis TaxID=1268659 RepID=UPI00315DE078